MSILALPLIKNVSNPDIYGRAMAEMCERVFALIYAGQFGSPQQLSPNEQRAGEVIVNATAHP